MAIVLSNPTVEETLYDLDGSWYMIADGKDATCDGVKICDGQITIPAYTVIILVNGICASS